MAGAILIAYDGSAHARAAVRRAGALLTPRPTTVLHVADSFEGAAPAALLGAPAGAATTAVRRVGAEAHAHAERLAAEGAELARSAGLPAASRVVQNPGAPWSAICGVADEIGADVIVAGTRGRSGLAAAVVGSTAQGLLRHAGRPVLVVSAKG
jgi:nucleotide-binding universal stress UspA family protein